MSSNVTARANLRDVVRRLKRVMVNAGVENAGEHSRIHGDMPFQDAVQLFKDDMEVVNAKLDERSKRGERDGQAITVAHEIDKQLRGLAAQLAQLKNLAEDSEQKRAKLAKKTAKNRTEEDMRRITILEKEYAMRRELCEACEKGLETLKEKNQTLPTRDGQTDRERLMGSRIADTRRGGAATKYTNVHDAINQGEEGSGGAANLDKDEETKAAMAVKRQKDKMIDNALDQIAGVVDRLKDNAIAISQEVDRQNVALDNLEVKMDKTNDKLGKINGRLSKLVKGTSKLNIIVNVFIAIFILAIVGYILYEMDVLPI